jgi:TRAP-type C4-dicarboxylate transport system permease small subunit
MDDIDRGATREGMDLPQWLRRIIRPIEVVEIVLGSLFVLLIMALVLTQAIQRYTPFSGSAWTGEVARFALGWGSIVLAGYLLGRDEHITLHMIDHVVPSRALPWVIRVSQFIVLLIAIGMVRDGWQLVSVDTGRVSSAALIPLTVVYAIPFLGFVLTMLRAAIALVRPPVPVSIVVDGTIEIGFGDESLLRGTLGGASAGTDPISPDAHEQEFGR